HLAKVDVASSNLVSRSKATSPPFGAAFSCRAPRHLPAAAVPAACLLRMRLPRGPSPRIMTYPNTSAARGPFAAGQVRIPPPSPVVAVLPGNPGARLARPRGRTEVLPPDDRR